MVRHMQYDFSGETAVVTGSTKGTGCGTAAGLADAVLWLASDSADCVVGDIVRVSEGGNPE